MVSARAVNYSDVIMFEIRNQQENLVQNGILNASGFLWTNDAKLKCTGARNRDLGNRAKLRSLPVKLHGHDLRRTS